MNIFITGVSKGIGRELTKQLVKNGHTVWGIARSRKLLETLRKEIGNDHFLYSICDVGDKNEVVVARRALHKLSFSPDIVILNAGIYLQDTLPGFNNALLIEGFKTNLFGALTWVEYFLPDFLTKRRGHFIAISSTSAFQPDSTSISLPASKAALSMAFRSLRLRYRAQNIIFSTIHFGPIATNISANYTTPTGKPKYPFVLTSAQAAGDILKVIEDRESKDYFFPFITTLLFRMTLFFPDLIFAKISNYLKQ